MKLAHSSVRGHLFEKSGPAVDAEPSILVNGYWELKIKSDSELNLPLL